MLGQRVDLLAAVALGRALGADALDDAAGLDRAREHLERRGLGLLGEVHQLHAEPQVRLVAAVALDRLLEAHARERRLQLDVEAFLEGVHDRALDQVEHVVLLDERHLQVHLGELRLAVSAQVLVAEAARDLVVAVDARDHADLLEHLRALRQRVELARVHAARHQVVARALGRAVGQDRRLDVDEAVVLQVGAHGGREARALDQRLLQRPAAQVEVAVAHAQLLVGLDLVEHLERRRLRLVEHRDLLHQHLDLAGRALLVDLVALAPPHPAADGDYVLGAEPLQQLERAVDDALVLAVRGHLGHAVAVAQVDEHQLAVVAVVLDPAVEDDDLPLVGEVQVAAGVGTLPGCTLGHGPGVVPAIGAAFQPRARAQPTNHSTSADAKPSSHGHGIAWLAT